MSVHRLHSRTPPNGNADSKNNVHPLRPTNDKVDNALFEEVEVEEIAVRQGIEIDEREGPIMHWDLGEIEVTELDGITINRTPSKISPFVEIQKVPTHSALSGNHTGFAIEMADPESDTGYKHVGNVGQNYLLLPNEEVRNLAVEIAHQSGLDFKESRIFWDGSRFAHVIDFLGVEEEVAEGDAVGLSLITQNSYDRSWRYECALMGKRFLCDNGCLSGEFFARVSFKHLGTGGGGEADKEETWKHVVREGLGLIDRAPDNLAEFVRGLRLLKGVEMTDARLREIRREVLSKVPVTLWGQMLDRYLSHEEPTLYGLLQTGTYLTWHKKTLSVADLGHNERVVSDLLRYAFESLN